jgi:sulfotransferase famil protein
MSHFRFWLYVLRNGSFFGRPIDFKQARHTVLINLPAYPAPPATAYSAARDGLARTRLLGTVLENVAYWKGISVMHKNFFCVDSIKLSYLRILKSASTSVLKELLPLLDDQWSQVSLTDSQVDQLAASYGVHTMGGERRAYPVFTIVRNPFHRLVSVYRDLFESRNPDFVYRNYLFGILRADMSFAEFVKTLTIIPTTLLAPHFASQAEIVFRCGGLNQIKVFRLEKDAEQLRAFLSAFHIELGHNNRAGEYDYRTYYNAETIQLGRTLYNVDVTTFGYDEDYQSLFSFATKHT